jgi:hypothetical protein
VVGDSGFPIAGGSGTATDGAAAMEKGDEVVVAVIAPGIKGLFPNGEEGITPTPGEPAGA